MVGYQCVVVLLFFFFFFFFFFCVFFFFFLCFVCVFFMFIFVESVVFGLRLDLILYLLYFSVMAWWPGGDDLLSRSS